MKDKHPWGSCLVLAVLAVGCFAGGPLFFRDAGFMDLTHASCPPGRAFWFGTDTMGRDIFSMIWAGGSVSLFVGLTAALISTAASVLYGTASGLAPRRLDALLMRLTDILLSVPGLLFTVLLQAAWGRESPAGLALSIGLTNWMSIARVVRTQVRQIQGSEYVTAARCMGAGFLRILVRHLAPNFLPSILFMVVMNIRGAIAAEATLSFMGLGLPPETVSWGSMLALSERALLSGEWWTLLFPGAFLIAALLSVSDLGYALERRMMRMDRQI